MGWIIKLNLNVCVLLSAHSLKKKENNDLSLLIENPEELLNINNKTMKLW